MRNTPFQSPNVGNRKSRADGYQGLSARSSSQRQSGVKLASSVMRSKLDLQYRQFVQKLARRDLDLNPA